MLDFINLIKGLDQAIGNLEKKTLLKTYFSNIYGLKIGNKESLSLRSRDDWFSIFWAIYFLSGERLNRIISTKLLKMYVLEKKTQFKVTGIHVDISQLWVEVIESMH